MIIFIYVFSYAAQIIINQLIKHLYTHMPYCLLTKTFFAETYFPCLNTL